MLGDSLFPWAVESLLASREGMSMAGSVSRFLASASHERSFHQKAWTLGGWQGMIVREITGKIYAILPAIRFIEGPFRSTLKPVAKFIK